MLCDKIMQLLFWKCFVPGLQWTVPAKVVQGKKKQIICEMSWTNKSNPWNLENLGARYDSTSGVRTSTGRGTRQVVLMLWLTGVGLTNAKESVFPLYSFVCGAPSQQNKRINTVIYPYCSLTKPSVVQMLYK